MSKQQQPDKYKVAVVFINDTTTKKTTAPNRGIDQKPLIYFKCSSLNRARWLVNDRFGGDTNSPKIEFADIYEIGIRDAHPIARWTPENKWNNDVFNIQRN
jgi:hypothetical protein